MATPIAHDATDIRRHVDETNRRFADAYNRGDIEAAVRDVYTRDGRILPPDVGTIQGHDGIIQFWLGARQSGVTRVELSTVELQPMGDGAYEIGRAELSLGDGGRATAKFVVIWKQEDGQWRWHVDIWNLDPA